MVNTAVDYHWRERGIFRFALPEHHAGPVSPLTGNKSTGFPSQLPDTLVVTVFERTFFADTLLGENAVKG